MTASSALVFLDRALFSETVSLSEGIVKKPSVVLSDTATMSEVTAKTTTKPLSDSTTLSVSIANMPSLVKTEIIPILLTLGGFVAAKTITEVIRLTPWLWEKEKPVNSRWGN
jgi:hypothetical protein